MIDFSNLNEHIRPLNDDAMQRARDHWNNVAKPIGSLGVLEDLVVKIAGLTGNENVDISKRCVAVLCADNGVVAEGVSQSESDITTIIAGSIARGTSSVCTMSRPFGIDAVAIDMGMLAESDEPGVRHRRIIAGTNNIAEGPAMSIDEAQLAVQAGVHLAMELKAEGYKLIATGEMGIGNTTTSSAMTSVLLGMDVEEVTGKGAGLSDAGLARKVEVIKRAIAVNEPDPDNAFDVLRKLGGLDIAGMAGLFIGGAIHRVPVIVDGFISALAAYTASLLCPSSPVAMLASHVSAEPAAIMLLERLGLSPVIHAGMRLGEGTGAVCLVPLLDSALALYNGTTFEATGMDAYEVDL